MYNIFYAQGLWSSPHPWHLHLPWVRTHAQVFEGQVEPRISNNQNHSNLSFHLFLDSGSAAPIEVYVELVSQKYISIFVVSLLFVKYIFVSLLCVKYIFAFAFVGTTLSSLWIFFCNLSYSSDSFSLSSGGLGVPLLVHICRFLCISSFKQSSSMF